ncbi:glycosyltransferase family 4 protein [Paenibacillus harenae]|uniref:Glycosyltransferase involved in cell wall biosynthesis n=1 Tax=Paenibacillus harenae TaxID=306543 RepID=A0ABT9U6G6_PAEHA|nr:glycosyltransferase family 4 protein [Paenibacillus harenae]MDQ0115230.1 glycosyltransferase involved in cell wall biosynthesis [Paenibacillus harenae]
MNVLFVNYFDFSSNSAIHIFNFANHLADLRVDCGVCVPDNKQSVELIGKPRFKVYDFVDFRARTIHFRDGRPADLVHAWTPREIVRTTATQMTEYYGCKYIVHLEDNEEAIVASNLGVDYNKLVLLPEKVLDRMIDQLLSHPTRYKRFVQRADGVTAIIDKLLAFKSENQSSKVIWPGFESDLFEPLPINIALKRSLGIAETDFVIVYTGNVHHSNWQEVRSLYLAVAALNRDGFSVKLIRTGRNFVDFEDEALHSYRHCFVELGFVDRGMLPRLTSLADVFVQPGSPDIFNDYRFPSKLPEFFAMGKPVILPHTNIGRYMKDRDNCLLLYKGDAIEIYEKLIYLIANNEVRDAIGRSGRAFALANFSWEKSAKALHDFYLQVLGDQSSED